MLTRISASFLFLSLVAGAADAVPQTPPAVASVTTSSADEAALREVAEAWRQHYNAGDATKVATLYTDDAYYLSAHVLAHGREAIEAYWRQGIAAGGHIDWIRLEHVESSGELGYAVGRYQATNAGVTVDGRILIVMKKVKRAWRMAAHETVVRDQPERQ